MKKEVSVIVPVYNVERFLKKCLDSLVNQTLEDIEIIIVNDGSNDGSQSIITEYENKYPNKIKAFQKENGGLSDARNFGLEQANGEYIGFVDSDDFVRETMFEEMYHLAKKHRAEMVVCNLQKVNEKGEVTQRLTQIPNMPEKIVLEEHFSVFSDMSYFACNKLFHSDLFQNKRFKKGVHFEDIQLIPQLLLECRVIAQTQTYHYQYLERTDSITKTHTEKGLDIIRAVEDVEDAFGKSFYKSKKEELKGFQILEGFYTFLAYLAFVKDEKVYCKLSEELKRFLLKRNITKSEILQYNRFGKNYLVSLPIGKRVYYLLYLLGLNRLLRKLIH
ncbi:glycosyltransferase family 2 protein [Riemerella anatipestifer]|uniref:glycosyltransferase family 2 protein n=1 Tax=Riemerella anatipestifer TaxID=34085 RepID=UPI00129EC034|nr:glycosyltransferase family 2 protein [Riemerella anatipestifer]MDY3318704.1 glycosyltransferase family 2 protein [Riemerella anatipestifer]MDY3324975.1 glycosyltransferase family 2 protein [Riemerella anatipestifer]MDY3353784.1 glycosyltransferase family 2 protein [Riemerella anatipestifer]MRM83557.1 glycosyltransferase family 2 protein [Riemerella anatipestifer]